MVSATFFHGAETKLVNTGVVPIRNDNLATVLIVGTSPQFLVDPALQSINRPIEIVNRTQLNDFFGPDLGDYTITRYVDAAFDQLSSFGGAKFQVINVLKMDGVKTSTPVSESLTFDESYIVLGGRVENLVLQIPGSGGAILVEGVDYTFDPVCARVDLIPTSIEVGVGDTVLFDYNDVDLDSPNISDVVSEENTFGVNDTFTLIPGLVSLSLTGTGGTPTYLEGTDYTFDANTGIVTRITTGAIAFEETVEASYTYYDPRTVPAAQIIGTIDSEGVRTGLQAAILGYNLYGYLPKILISPGFSYCDPVTAELEVQANFLNAMAVVDAPQGTNYNRATTGRGPQGDINFNYSSDRLILQMPMFENTRQVTGQLELEFKSGRYAGLWCESIIQNGFWFSPSNIKYVGVEGVEGDIEHIPGRADTQANLLNSVGISTTINSFGQGFKEWGNRSSVFPSDTGSRNFIPTKFSEIAINEAINQVAETQYVDKPINDDLINAVLDTVNAYLRTLINAGGLIEGSRIYYDSTDNPPTVLANGQIIFTVEMLPPPPAERITFKSFLNINLLNNLNTGRQFLGV